MKLHYSNILLYVVNLSIFLISHKYPEELLHHFTSYTKHEKNTTTRLLCESTCLTSASENDSLLCFYGRKSGFVPGTSVSSRDVIGTTVKEIVKKSTNAATQAAETAANETTSGMIEAELSKITSAGANLHSAITYSVTAILVIVLVMVIIYLILRYRRKKKMKKKLQYIKLLKE
ncbi:hypothetical protein PFAG_01653 [Plasmodium falciparum Santa Lucia]|uniref:Surface antigen n=1 Tax=Plasmodium falciparum Santa Lucia TaxID=478859 RepID=W7G1A8_PLAFA|nr:hypothetical protein PFAG_01653 [Plasmodium falciparum Santa Lucia]